MDPECMKVVALVSSIFEQGWENKAREIINVDTKVFEAGRSWRVNWPFYKLQWINCKGCVAL